MVEVSIIGIDLAKRVFQVHGTAANGSVVFRRKLSRQKLLGYLSQQPRCRVAMEACATAHYWGREIMKFGHEVKLIPPIYVKPFVKRQKNDAADSEAIAEAASRPTMRFVTVKTEDQQANSMLFRQGPSGETTNTAGECLAWTSRGVWSHCGTRHHSPRPTDPCDRRLCFWPAESGAAAG